VTESHCSSLTVSLAQIRIGCMHDVTGAGKAQRNFKTHEGALRHYFEREPRESKGSRSKM